MVVLKVQFTVQQPSYQHEYDNSKEVISNKIGMIEVMVEYMCEHKLSYDC